MKESPLFTRTYDFVRWLIPVTVKFPRQQRFVLAAVLQQNALRFQEQIIEAAQSRSPRSTLEQANVTLTKLRTQLRLAHDLSLLSKGQYVHAAGMLSEIGKLLGGWMKAARPATQNIQPGEQKEGIIDETMGPGEDRPGGARRVVEQQ